MQVACATKNQTLCGLSDEKRQWLEERAERMVAPQGSYILKQCQRESRVFYLVEGRIKISVFLPGGVEKTLCIVEPGNLIGEVGVFDDNSYPVSAMALRHSELMWWSEDLVREAVRQYSEVAFAVMSSLAQKLRLLATQVESLSTVTAQERVADLFVHLAEVYGTPSPRGRKITLRLTQQDIANLAGTSRVSVSNSFRVFKAKGLVTKRQGFYYVQDIEGLRPEGSGTGDFTRLTDEALIPQSDG